MRIVRKVIVPAIKKEMLVRVIEFVSEALVEDAKNNFGKSLGFRTDMRMIGDTLETYIQFFPYKYDFIWKINQGRLGYEVVLDARTPGKWRGTFFGSNERLSKLTETQWSAFVNFCHGYLTALSSRGKPTRAHISKTRKRIKER